MSGVLTLRLSIADVDSADGSESGFLRFRTIAGALTDPEWHSLADRIPTLAVKCVSRRKSIRLEPIKVDWDVHGTGCSKFGSLKVSPSKKGFVQIEFVLDENDHDSIVAELVNGEDVLRPIADSVNWRAKYPAVPITIVSCLYEGLQDDVEGVEEDDRVEVKEESAEEQDADTQPEDVQHEDVKEEDSEKKAVEDAKNEVDDAVKEGVEAAVVEKEDAVKKVIDAEMEEVDDVEQSAAEQEEDTREEDEEDEEAGPAAAAAAPSSSSQDMQKRLFELRMKMNQARALNKKQIQEEETRLTETPAQRKKRLEREYRKRQQEEREQHPPTKEEKDAQLLHQTSESVEAQRVRESKKKPAAFGWDVFNQDALYRAYKKRAKNIPSGAAVPEVDDKDNELNYGLTPRPSNAAIDNMVSELTETNKRRQKFSRRRQFYEDETVSYINERNRVFNKKVARFFDPYTQELKANIEKGTG